MLVRVPDVGEEGLPRGEFGGSRDVVLRDHVGFDFLGHLEDEWKRRKRGRERVGVGELTKKVEAEGGRRWREEKRRTR